MVRADRHQKNILLGADALPIAVNGSAEDIEARWKSGESGLVDARGRPISSKFLGSAASSYLAGLSSARRPSELRATDPYANHVWVYAAAMIVATVKAQAQAMIWRETEGQVQRRAIRAKSLGRSFVPGRGLRRRALERHIDVSSLRRVFARGLEPDLEHPVSGLLFNPNPLQDISQLMQFTDIVLQLHGECFWVKVGADGGRLSESGEVGQIWPFAPELFTPVLTGRDHGELIGWEMRAPRLGPDELFGNARRVQFDLDEVVHFKLPNPSDPSRGMSRIASAAQAVEMDLAVHEHGRSLLRNDGVPKGVVSYKGIVNEKEQAEITRRWEERHKGKDKSGRTAFLFNGFEYQSLALSPEDMQFLAQREWDRTEILAAFGVPPSIVGVTDVINYATALAQEKGFWERTVIPLARVEESAIDRGLLFDAPDTTFFAFDMRGVEALRVGVAEKIEAADRMCGNNLHCPPRVAYEVVGLEVPEYEGDQVSLVGALATPLDYVLSGEAQSQGSGVVDDGSTDTEGDEKEATDDGSSDAAAKGVSAPILIRSSRSRKARAGKIWRGFVKLEVALEGKMRRAYRTWVRDEKSDALERFDASARDGRSAKAKLDAIIKQISLGAILPDLKRSGDALKKQGRPVYLATTEQTFEFTLGEIGVPVFAIDAPQIVQHWDARERIFVESVPKTVYESLRTSLTAGIEAAETVQQLRLRVAQVYDVSASSSKSLLIARTETAGLMNGVRDAMFGLQGVTEEDWLSAGDEATRPDHIAYGEAGSRPRGFNWLGIQDSTGHGGTLEYPGDTRAPVGQVANCRCAKGVIS